VTLTALDIAEWQPHVIRLTVATHEELQGVDSRHRPHAQAHAEIGTAMAGDAPDFRLLVVVETGEVSGRTRNQPFEFLVMKMAGDAETVITLFGGESSQEEHADDEGPYDGSHAHRQTPGERACHQRAFRRMLSAP
jgi:hypothetical protein